MTWNNEKHKENPHESTITAIVGIDTWSDHLHWWWSYTMFTTNQFFFSMAALLQTTYLKTTPSPHPPPEFRQQWLFGKRFLMSDFFLIAALFFMMLVFEVFHKLGQTIAKWLHHFLSSWLRNGVTIQAGLNFTRRNNLKVRRFSHGLSCKTPLQTHTKQSMLLPTTQSGPNPWTVLIPKMPRLT